VGGEEEVSGTSAAVEAKISTSPSELGANCCRSRVRRLLPITHAPFGPGHTLADRSRDRSRPHPHWLRTVPLPATSSPLTPLPRSPVRSPTRVPFPLVLVPLPLAHTSGFLVSHLSLLPRIPHQPSIQSCLAFPSQPSIRPPPPVCAASHPGMARTKQTARQSTGGTAKRQLLGLPTWTLRSHSSRSSRSSHSLRTTPDVEMVESPPLDLGASTAGNAVPQVVAGEVDQVASKVGVMGGEDADHVSEQ
jgi:hypothetical protein